MFGMGMQELIIVGIIAVLLFGKRLPEVAKSLGSSYREFRKGLTDLQSQINIDEITSTTTSMESSYSGSAYDEFDDNEDVSAPKFEPPPSEPQATTPDETVPDETVPDEAVPDEAVPDEAVPDGEISKPVSEK